MTSHTKFLLTILALAALPWLAVRNGIFDPQQLLAIQNTRDGLIATFHFVVNAP